MENEAVVLREQRDNILILTLNRPKNGNAVVPELAKLLDKYLNEAEVDDSVAVVIITGAGEKIFCGGMDLKFLAMHPEESEECRIPGHGWCAITERYFPKPLIAAVNGFALGGGTEIATACDLIVASENAKFGLPEVKRGIFAAAGGPIRLARQLPRATALYIALTGDHITAAQAKEMGLVSEVVPQDQLMDAAINLAKRIAVNAPLSVKFTKELLYKSMDMTLEEAFAYSAEHGKAVLKSEDAKEGPLAFAEKRDPVWKGR